MVVYIYEIVSNQMHNYSVPSEQSFRSIGSSTSEWKGWTRTEKSWSEACSANFGPVAIHVVARNAVDPRRDRFVAFFALVAGCMLMRCRSSSLWRFGAILHSSRGDTGRSRLVV